MKKIASITIGIILAAVLLFFGFSIIQNRFSKASGPKDSSFAITNITSNSLDFSYLTSDANDPSQIVYGTECTEAGLTLFALPEPSTPSGSDITMTAHLTLLEPATQYFMKVLVNDRSVTDTCVTATTLAKGATETTGASLTPAAPLLLRPTAAPTVAPTIAVTPAASITDCSIISNGIGTIYTAFDYSACQSRNTALTPTAAAN